MRSSAGAMAVALLLAACSSPATVAASPTFTATLAPASAGSAAPAAPLTAPVSVVMSGGGWYLLPDGFSHDGVRVAVAFPEGDMSAGRPRARLRSTGKTIDLVPDYAVVAPGASPYWSGIIPLDGVRPGEDAFDVLVRLRDSTDVTVAQRTLLLSYPEYVVWTLDFEGDAAGDDTLANTAAIADGLHVPMTLMWNPRVWTTTDVSAARADAMLAWTKGRAGKGDEVALHLHAWTDFVRDAGVAPRTAPNWAGRSDGYDVPLTAFDEAETGTLLVRALALMAQHGMPRPSSFRGGGLFGNAANLRAVAAAGFSVDASATSAGIFGQLTLPWTLAKDAQPYRPSRDDANKTGDLSLLEVPNIAGNTYGLTVNTILSTIRADFAMLAPPGQAATAPRVLTLVSHPGTIDASERAAIEALFTALEPYRFDKGNGPLRFVTLAQLAQALK